MVKNVIRWTEERGVLTLTLLLVFALFISACGAKPAPGNTALAAKEADPAAISAGNSEAAGKPVVAATTGNQQKTNSGLDCTAIVKANQDFGTGLAQMVNLTADTNYSAFTDPSSPFYMDFAKLRAELNTLATLPDPTAAVELTFGKPSESVTYFRQVLDIAEGDVKAQGKPFKDTSSTGQVVLGISSPWFKEFNPFALAMSDACSNVVLPTDTPLSDKPTNQLGEVAVMGDLRVTLSKVATVPGEPGNLPAPGNDFVFVSVTVENTGKAQLVTNSVAQATLKDTTGKQYFIEANAIMLPYSHPLNGELAPGERTSGTIGYQLPTNAGDLLWIVEDNAPHRAVFAVKAGDIGVEGTAIGESTAAAMRTSVEATTAAIIEMAGNADATAAAMTASPQTPETPDTPQLTDTPEPTETPQPTDTPSP
jgi:Domain of unknown function (DUF4352)